ncbi:MAG: hypothetical protein A3G28_06730 [Betaproteobacteria bacterium RIFCSPLOWO2_12_FULL_68_19]|nr:MAG: hypothetical protein A3G28_06730 [Betaproteobacteria bacterium RIFCSPLOWO2_12_FULL_68_19]
MGLVGRRQFLLLAAAALAASPATQAQTQRRRSRIATLEDARQGALAENWRSFRGRLRELGYVEESDFVLDARSSQGDLARLPALAAELVSLKPDVIVTTSTPTTRAAMQATSTVPIVFVGIAEPVETGLVASLARPGGNVTGQAIVSAELSAKWIELLLEIEPNVRKLAYLGQAANQAVMAVYRSMQQTANARKLFVRLLEATNPQEIDRAFEVMRKEDFDAFICAAAPVILPYRQQIVDLAARQRLPSAYARSEYVAAGGLLSYAPDRSDMFRRTAKYVHRVLQGAKLAELPVEQPMKFDLVINLKTARGLGITIPQSMLLRADRVIE